MKEVFRQVNKKLVFSDIENPLTDKIVFLKDNIASFLHTPDKSTSGSYYELKETDYYEEDLAFLGKIESQPIASGAIDSILYPFICKTKTSMPLPVWQLILTTIIPMYKTKKRLMSARNILKTLKVKNFRSDYIKNFNLTALPFPGDHPMELNDEIHSDFEAQYMFPVSDKNSNPLEPSDGIHGLLLSYLYANPIWYLVLHSWQDSEKGPYVLLFAVGESKISGDLIGFVSYQMCHNLCD